MPLSARALTLRRAIQTLSATSAARPLLSKWRLNLTLRDAFEESPLASSQPIPSDQPILNDLEWLVIGKAAIQVHGLVLNELIDQTLPLGDGIWYWTQIRGSYRLTALYTIQTMPLRLLGWGKDIYADARGKLDRVLGEADSSRVSTSGAQASDLQESLLSNWKQFYDLVRESIRERSIGSFQQQVLSPISLCRAEARSKQSSLRSLRERTASALGILVDEAFTFDAEETNNNNNNNNNNGSSRSSKSRDRNGSAVMAQAEWREIVEKSIALLESVLKNVGADGTPGANLDDTVFAAVEADPDLAADDRARSPSRLALKLQGVLNEHLAREKLQFQAAARQYGIPSPSIRYWLPATILVLSSSTILRIIFSREAAILTWFRELGQTVVDFWANWIVSPAEKIIRTIRHDEGSEVALMSKRSLQGDRDSLERMVVDFAVDNPQCASADGNASRLDRQAIEAIRAGIKEGDLTPVLRAYERDIRHPLRGAVVGNLARALLIQVQKTKVDVEVAISGIDSLLKSQELVFG